MNFHLESKTENYREFKGRGNVVMPELRVPSSWQKFNTESGLHPTQKPVKLFEYIINTYTNEGETVLDNCGGSGTTAIACINTNRSYILMEKEEKYYNIIQERIANHKPLPKVIPMNGAPQPEIHKEKMPTQQIQQMLLNL